eukprot:SAG11_NODE_1237_length_5426_cov_4.878543_2_plen_111_part_00
MVLSNRPTKCFTFTTWSETELDISQVPLSPHNGTSGFGKVGERHQPDPLTVRTAVVAHHEPRTSPTRTRGGAHRTSPICARGARVTMHAHGHSEGGKAECRKHKSDLDLP